jgi:hypothetical protein
MQTQEELLQIEKLIGFSHVFPRKKARENN